MASTSVLNYNYKRSYKPVIDFATLSPEETNWIFQIEPTQLLYFTQSANSYNQSTLTWNVNSIPSNVACEKRLDMRCSAQVLLQIPFSQAFYNLNTPGNVYNAATFAAGVASAVQNYISVRDYPIQSSASNCVITLNGLSFTYQENWFASDLTRFYDDNQNKIGQSFGPVFHDPFPWYTQQYNNGTSVGPALNSLTDYPLDNNIVNDVNHRGVYCEFAANGVPYNSTVYPAIETVGGNPSVNVQEVLMTVTWNENIIVEPFKYKDSDECAGLLQLKNMNINFNFNTSIFQTMVAVNFAQSSMFRSINASGAVVTSYTLPVSLIPSGAGSGTLSNWVGIPTLMQKQYSLPPANMYNLTNSLRLIYPYTNILINSAGANLTLAPGAVGTVQYSFSTSFVASKFYIYMKESSSNINLNQQQAQCPLALAPDEATGYKPLLFNVIYNQNPSVLSSASLFDLYKQAVELGYHGSYVQWAAGSIIAFDTAALNLPSNLTRGAQQTINITINASFINYSPFTRVCDMYIIQTVPGSMLIENSNIILSTGIIDIAPMLMDETPFITDVDKSMMRQWNRSFYAGKLIDNFKGLLKQHGPKLLKDYGPVVGELIAKYGPQALSYLIGAGYTEAKARKIMKKAGLAVGGENLGGSYGGAIPDYDKLKSRLMKC